MSSSREAGGSQYNPVMAKRPTKRPQAGLNSYGENIQYLKVHERSLQDGSRLPPRLAQDASRTANIAQHDLRDECKMVEIAQILFVFTLLHVFPEGFPNRLGEHMVQ